MGDDKKPSEKIRFGGGRSFYFWVVLLCLFFLTSCIPTAINEKATCDTGKTFDSLTRSCVTISLVSIPITSSLSFNEDVTTDLTLSYRDHDNDNATSCDATTSPSRDTEISLISCSCLGGNCTVRINSEPNWNGQSEFSYRITDNDGTSPYKLVSLTVTPINDPPIIDATTYKGEEGTNKTFDLSDNGTVIDPDVATNGEALTYEVELLDINDGIFESGTGKDSNNTGQFTFDPSGDISGEISFKVTVRDLIHEITKDMTIDLEATDDTLIGTSPPLTIIEDSSTEVTLSYRDPDASYDISHDTTADACEVDVSSDHGTDFFASSACACDPTGVCKVTLMAANNINSSIPGRSFNFSYRLQDSSWGAWGEYHNVDVTIDAVSDKPLAFSFDVNAIESNTIDATAITFKIADATAALMFDGDQFHESTSDAKFYISRAPSHGTLTCYTGDENDDADTTFDVSTDVSITSDASFDANRECKYLPRTGNLSGEGTEASVDLKSVNFKSRFKGEAGNYIRIFVIPFDSTADKEFIEVVGQANEATVDIKIYVSLDTTPDVVASLVDGHPVASLLVDASALSNTPMVSSSSDSTYDNLEGGTNAADSFSYFVCDDSNPDCTIPQSDLSNIATVNFNIQATNDSTTLCHYSLYEYAPECGLNDCFDNSSPYNRITPSSHNSEANEPVIYYDRSNSVCWESTGTSKTDWKVISSRIQNQIVNEKGKIVISGIRISEGGAEEASQVLKLGGDITSDNNILIPKQNIKFYYGSTEITPGADLDDNTYSSDASEFRIEIVPVSGQSGKSNIHFKIFDDNNDYLDVSFDVTVNAVSAQHNGWVSLSAVGPKVNKYEQPKDESAICPYSETKCGSGSPCLGTTSPKDAIIPDVAYAIYYDSENNKCYYSTSGDSSADWTEFTDPLYCPISQSDLANECNSSVRGSCIFNQDTSADLFSDMNVDGSSDYNNIYYNLKTKKCYRNVTNSVPNNVADIEEIYAGASVYLEWNAFTISGTGAELKGYNVYRRVAKSGYKFDYDSPINKTLISSTITSYTDNGTNSKTPPIPGTVYFYEVRPVITFGGSDIPTDTSEVYKTIRVIAPPNNMVFVHQSMANKGICSLMNAESDPRYQNYCTYQGPGEKIDDDGTRTSLVFDVKHHLLVDRFEAGCHFTNPPVCSGTNDGSCIRISDPTGDPADSNDDVDASDDKIFYDRGSGNCIIKKPGHWKIIEASTDITTLDEFEFDHRLAELPPFVNIKQEFAHDFCKLRSTNKISKIVGLVNDNVSTSLKGRLPSRTEQIAYSLWPSTMTTSSIQNIEEGLSLNASSKCNTAQANGLSDKYSDADHPDSNTLYTIPGSRTSGIRSLMTGSDLTNGTSSCSSQFGVQDAVGNVKEWVFDRIKCPSLSTCEGIVKGDSPGDELLPPSVVPNDGTGDHFNTSDSYASFQKYKLDGKIGPCRDSNSDGDCDSFMGEWEFDDQLFSAGRFIVPMGLPAHTDFPNNYSSDVSPYLLEIGPTNGITNARLANDKFILNSHHIFAEKEGCGSLAGGGGYLDNGGAGVFHLEVIPCTDTSYQYITVGQMSIKALKKEPQLKLTINATSDLGSGGTVQIGSANTIDNSADIYIEATTDVSTYLNIVTQLDISLNATVDAVVSEGDGGDVISQSTSQTSFTVINSSPKRPDVGFRCVVPLPDSNTIFEEPVP